MKSKFVSGFITSFFAILLFAVIIFKESGPVIGEILFSLSLAAFFEAAIHGANIDIKLQILMGIIFVMLAIYDLTLLSPEYSICLLAAFIPFAISNVLYFRCGESRVNILLLSIAEVFVIFLSIVSAFGLIVRYLSFEPNWFLLNGASFESLVPAFLLYAGSLIVMVTTTKKRLACEWKMKA